jgi:anti-anti-sigma factor
MNATSELPISIFKDITFVNTPERLSISEVTQFRSYLAQVCLTEQRRIVINMAATSFIDSSGINALWEFQRLAISSGNEVVFWSLQPHILDILKITNPDRILNFESATNTTRIELNDVMPFHRSIHSPWKRGVDILGALVGLVITAILFIPIAIAIKLDSPGPILFSQTRCGFMGKRFRIWKFRSMISNAEQLKSEVSNQAEGNFFKNEEDPRITRVGKFLRKTSLDEFPQFWNVLVGDMSLVGTRPPTTDEVANYKFELHQLDLDTLFNEWCRLDVKPGMTGEWQVRGRSSVRNFEDVVKLDLQYQKNWNLGYDLWLILKTVIVIFDKKNQAV